MQLSRNIFTDQHEFEKHQKTYSKSQDSEALDPGDGGGGTGGTGGTGSYTLMMFEHAHYGGYSKGISTNYTNLDPIGFHDQMSSLRTAALPAGETITLYEDINYGGKRIVIEPNGHSIELACLCDFKIGSTGPHTIYITGGQVIDQGAICGFACNSWNDEVSSVYFSRF